MLCQPCQKLRLPLIALPDYHLEQKRKKKEKHKNSVSGIVANAQQIVFFLWAVVPFKTEGVLFSVHWLESTVFGSADSPNPYCLLDLFFSNLGCVLTLIYSSAQNLGCFPMLPDIAHM